MGIVAFGASGIVPCFGTDCKVACAPRAFAAREASRDLARRNCSSEGLFLNVAPREFERVKALFQLR